MQPFIKWAGGKDKELKFILPALPGEYNDYFEPFVGGGSVFAALNARHFYINDFSTELIGLYRLIAERNNDFFNYASLIDQAWSAADRFFDDSPELIGYYSRYRADQLTRQEFLIELDQYCRDNIERIRAILPQPLAFIDRLLVEEIIRNVKRKMLRMKDLEQKKHSLPDSDVCANIRTAIKSSVYMYFRRLYNDGGNDAIDPALRTALFLFIRNYCYSGMFRYNSSGEFNVPYGGMAYNNKYLDRKLDYYRSDEVAARMAMTTVENLDFEEFFNLHVPTADDFVFLDPPYDSEFSTYARNEFNRADHIRLADYLINRCEAKWMMVIKNTAFILDLYSRPDINMCSFDKTYQVSFMNRNDRETEHLIITNY